MRVEQILTAAVELASREGYRRLTRGDVARAAGCSEALLSHYFLSAAVLREEILRAGVAAGCLPIIAEGLAVRAPEALAASVELRQAAALSLLPR